MENRTKRILATVLFIVFIASIWTAYAVYEISSNEIEYYVADSVLALDVPETPNVRVNTTVTFSGNLTLHGQGVAGQTITIFQRDPDPDVQWKPLVITVTNQTGYYSANYTLLQVGTFRFKAMLLEP